MRLRAAIALWLALAGCQTDGGSAPAPEAAAAGPEVVSFVFGWEPGLRATMNSTRTRTREAETTTTRSSKSQVDLQVAAEGDGLRVRFTNPTFELTDAKQPVPAAAQAQLLADLADATPDYLVTREGEFAGVRDLPALQARIQSILRRSMPASASPADVTRIEEMITSEEVLTASAASQWNALVGLWAGAQMQLGQEHKQSSREPVPMLPGQQVLMNYSFLAKARSSCMRSGVERQCVDVEMRSTSDPADSALVVEEVLKKLSGIEAAKMPLIRSLDIETSIALRTEPEGLFPHQCTVTKTVRASMEADGKTVELKQTDRTEMQLTYR